MELLFAKNHKIRRLAIILFKDCFLVLMVLTTYGLVGGFAIIPFRHQMKYSILAAPMAGMLLWSLSTFLLYTYAHLPLKLVATSIGLTGAGVTLACIVYLRPKINYREILFLLACLLLVCLVVTITTNIFSIQTNGDSLLFTDGLDHPIYAAIADFLNSHLSDQHPVCNPNDVSQTFPSIVFKSDNRFGTFINFSIISNLLHKSGFYSYDLASAIVLVTGFLSIGAVFCRSRFTLVFSMIAINVGFMFILSRIGWLGRSSGFPPVIFIVGLYLINQTRKQTLFEQLGLIILTLSAAFFYPGFVLGIFLLAVGGIFLTINLIYYLMKPTINDLWVLRDKALLLVILILTAVSVAGLITVPNPNNVLGLDHMPLPYSWFEVLLDQFDLRYVYHENLFSWYTPEIAIEFLTIAIISVIVLAIVSISKTTNIISTTLSMSCLLFFFIPMVAGDKYFSTHVSGLIYPLFIAACAWLADQIKLEPVQWNKYDKKIIYSIMVITIAVRIPSYLENLHRYAGGGVQSYAIYNKRELVNVYKLVKNKPLLIEVPNVVDLIPVMYEVSRRVNLQWPDETWAHTGQRTQEWQPPPLKPANLVLGLKPEMLAVLGYKSLQPKGCKLIATTHQYLLYNCLQAKNGKTPLTYSTS